MRSWFAVTLAMALTALVGGLTPAGLRVVDECKGLPDGVFCTDTDGNECTLARCRAGVCNQNTGSNIGYKCEDTDGNECTDAECDRVGNCDQNRVVNDGQVCRDTDGNGCTVARCVQTRCEQDADLTFNQGLPCPDTDADPCTEARCDELGRCDQDAVFVCASECHGLPKGALCADTDDNECTEARCDRIGDCNQDNALPAGARCADTDSNECTVARCNGAGSCNQRGQILADDECPDTDGNECTHAVCSVKGVCEQAVSRHPGYACSDTDGNDCTTAGCDGTGACDQDAHILVGQACPDTDENPCTTAACDGHGDCRPLSSCAAAAPPLIRCPPHTQVVCGTNTGPAVTGEAVAVDDCDPEVQIAFTDDIVLPARPEDPVQERIERTWLATNDCQQMARCTQTITVHKQELFLDIKPGSCPNPLNTHSQGVIPIGLVGAAGLGVGTLDGTSVGLSRGDGVGGVVAPLSWTWRDTATPFGGQPCECHTLKGDGMMDLLLRFSAPAVVRELQFDGVAPGSVVSLVVSGMLSNGCAFIAADCVVRTPVQGGP